MSFPSEINVFDLALAVILGVFTIRGFIYGFFAELSGLVGLIGGVILAKQYYRDLASVITDYLSAGSWAHILAYVVILCGTMAVAALLASLLSKLFSAVQLGWLDHLAGGLAGFLKGFILSALLVTAFTYVLGDVDFMRSSLLTPLIREYTQELRSILPFSL